MKRLLRFLSAALAVACAILCVATCVLWARSYSIRDILSRTAFDPSTRFINSVSIISSPGCVNICLNRVLAQPDGAKNWAGVGPLYEAKADGAPTAWNDQLTTRPNRFLHFGYDLESFRSTADPFTNTAAAPGVQDMLSASATFAMDSFVLCVPAWFAAGLFALPPAIWLRRARRRFRIARRARDGLCLCCGYDLRASPAGCPECGAPATTRVA